MPTYEYRYKSPITLMIGNSIPLKFEECEDGIYRAYTTIENLEKDPNYKNIIKVVKKQNDKKQTIDEKSIKDEKVEDIKEELEKEEEIKPKQRKKLPLEEERVIGKVNQISTNDSNLLVNGEVVIGKSSKQK